jgi:isopenicillin N synthase-like dioxygenase
VSHTQEPAVPVVDMEPLLRAERVGEAQPAIDALYAACRDWGAFQLVGHGIADELMRGLCAEMRRFFALPSRDKESVRRGPDNSRGYNDSELTKNARDWKEVFDFGFVAHPELPDDHPANRTEDGANLWPEMLPDFEPTLKEYFEACTALSGKLLEGICAGLGLAPQILHRHFEGVHTSFLRLNHYAPCPDPTPPDSPTLPAIGQLGVGHHTDAGAFTFVCQDGIDGLQIERAGHWHTVEALPGALVVNLADMLQVWSNDRLRSPLHRVIASAEGERFSAPFFFNPAYDTLCAPLAGLTHAEQPPLYSAIRWGEFRKLRADGDYADLGEEVQISHYRLQPEAG